MPRCSSLLLPLLALALSQVAASPPTIKITADLPYKEGPSLTEYETTRCRLDVHVPAGASDGLPVLVWFHGGGITAGDKGGNKTQPVASRLAQDGLVVASVNYRLSPKATYPAYLEDAAASVAWVIKNAARFGGDPAKVFVAGHSAGGYLTTMLALDPRYLATHQLKPESVRGYIPVAGQMITHATVRQERGIPKTTLIVDEAAPLYHVRKDLPPMLILYAEKDMLMRAEENRFFAEALTAAGCTNFRIEEVPGQDHGGIGEGMHQEDHPTRKLITGFIQATLATP